MTTTTDILKVTKTNNKTIVLYVNDFNNHHIAIWDGYNTDFDGDHGSLFRSLPLNFNQTGSFGKFRNRIVDETFAKMVKLAETGMENWIIRKSIY